MDIANDNIPGVVLVQADKLRNVFQRHVIKGTTAGQDGQRPSDLAREIDPVIEKMVERLNNGTYRFTPYLEMLKAKSARKLPRVISIATVRDRIALRALADILSDQFNLIRESPQEKIERIRSEFLNLKGDYNAFIKIDIKNFYPEIDHDLLRSKLCRTVDSPALINLVINACRTPTVPRGASRPHAPSGKGVPQGLSISNLLAEVFLDDFDQAMRNRTDLRYFRYADDVLVFCRSEDASAIEDQMRRSLIRDFGLMPHVRSSGEGKSAIGFLGLDELQYLGYVFTRDRKENRVVSIRRSSRIKHENSIAKVFTDFKYRASKPPEMVDSEKWKGDNAARCEWWLNFVITGCVFDNERRGWIQYFSKTTDYKLLNSLDNFVEKLIRKFGLSETVKPKSHRRAHRSINQRGKRRAGYIIDFDVMDVGEKFDILVQYFGVSERMLLKQTSDKIESIFHSKMKWKINELDRDIGATS